MRILCTLRWCVLTFFCTALAWAQVESARVVPLHEPPTTGLTSPETFTKDVHEVNLFFTARDRRGRIRTDLKFEDIKLADNGRPPERVSRFEARTELPLSVVLLVDTSDSITEKLKAEKAAALVFLEQVLRPELDEVMVATFGQNVGVVQGFTGDPVRVRKSVEGLTAGGATAFYDAIAFAASELARSGRKTSRHIIIVISDGQENHSAASEKTAMAEVLRSDAVIFALSTKGEFVVRPSFPLTVDEEGFVLLRKFARATGGKVVPAENHKRLLAAFAQIQEELRSQYFVAYKPAAFVADGSYRRIKLSGGGLHFYARTGYYSTSRK